MSSTLYAPQIVYTLCGMSDSGPKPSLLVGKIARAWRLDAKKTLAEVADAIGMDPGNLSKAERGHLGLTVEKVRLLERYFHKAPGTSLSEISGEANIVERGDKASGSGNVGPAPALHELPLVSYVQAGNWHPVGDPYQPGDYERLVRVTRRYSKHAYALRVMGDSMQASSGPSFPEGSIIAVEPEHSPENGSFVVVRLEDTEEATFKQLVVDGERRYLKPLNPRYPIMEITGDATFCGVVRQMVMDF